MLRGVTQVDSTDSVCKYIPGPFKHRKSHKGTKYVCFDFFFLYYFSCLVLVLFINWHNTGHRDICLLKPEIMQLPFLYKLTAGFKIFYGIKNCI